MEYQTDTEIKSVILSINNDLNKVLTDKLTPIIENAQNNKAKN